MKNESRIMEREQKQLARLERLRNKKPYAGYFAMILLLVALSFDFFAMLRQKKSLAH